MNVIEQHKSTHGENGSVAEEQCQERAEEDCADTRQFEEKAEFMRDVLERLSTDDGKYAFPTLPPVWKETSNQREREEEKLLLRLPLFRAMTEARNLAW